jgi:membrane protein required for colicin V production
MSAGDWVIVGVLLISVLQAASQGFFLEVFSLAGVVLGFLLASWEYPVVAGWLTFINPSWVAEIVGFFAIFLCVMILSGVIGRIVSWAVREAGLRWADRVLGGAFGLVRGFLVVTVVVLGMAAFAPTSQLLARSNMAPYFLVLGRAASWLTPSDVRARVRQGIEVLHRGKVMTDDSKPSAGSPTGTDKKQSAASGN